MLGRDAREVLDYVRLSQLHRYGRRVLRLPAARLTDFLIRLPPDEADRLCSIAGAIRGTDPVPAIFIHGVLPRSGTNYLADALALHPHVYAHPGRLWEFPLLYVAHGAEALQKELLCMYKRNREVMGRYDLLAYLASGWLITLQGEAKNRRILLKSPHVQNITLFPNVFPRDILLLCLRDGRDIIQSSLKTFQKRRWRNKGFSELAREWAYGTEAILTFEPGGENAYDNAKVVRYEALVREPEAVLRDILLHAGLDPEMYNFDALSRLPVRGSSMYGNNDNRWSEHKKTTDFQPIGRWVVAWSSRQKARFKNIAGSTLVRAGYAADDRW